jgi:hypothetical protein
MKKHIAHVRSLSKACIITVGAIALCGCSTIFTGTKSKVQIESVPSGARVQVDGVDRGVVTPTPVSLKRGASGQTVTLLMSGYRPKSFQPETTFSTVSVLNLFSLLGWGIDAASGALWTYEPKFYSIQLERAR